MSVPTAASDRLSHLLELADQGPALRAALAEEVAELLTHWPDDCPQQMRGMCESLLAKCARDVEPAARARLRVQLHSDPGLSARVLPREPAGRILVEAARSGGNICDALAATLGLDNQTAAMILRDACGEKLAMACKGGGIGRAAFSALALTLHPCRDADAAFALLDRFDAIDMEEARGTLRAWRAMPALESEPV